jgi:type II restriction enzyme
LKEFIDDSEVRNRRYKKQEELQEIEVTLPNGKLVKFSPGDHNELQGRIIDAFLSIFAPGSEVLYVGDTTDKYLVLDEDKLTELGLDLSKTSHTKLPDVVLFDKKRNWVFFIEAVTSHGPIGDKRMHSLEKMTSKLKAGSVFVTAFLNRKDFRKFSADIAWESEVWIAENPNHMIHFNGDRFMGPRK